MSNAVPEGWHIKTIGDICNIAIGGTPSRSVPEYWDSAKTSGSPWVSIRDLKKPLVYETSEYITESGIKNSNVKLIKKGTVLMSFKLSVGRVAFAGRDLYSNEAIAAFLPKSKNTYSDQFLYQGLQHWNLLENIDQAVKGVTLNKEKINQIEALLPPLPEQQKIASILSSVDKVIETTRAQIDKLKDLKTGMMQELLTKGIGHSEFQDSPVGRIPSDWGFQTLRDVCKRVCVGFVGTCERHYRVSGVPMIRTGNLKNGRLELTEIKYVTKEFHEKEKKSQLREGDLLIARHGSHGSACIVPGNLGEANCLNVVVVRPSKEKALPLFLKYVFNSGAMKASFGAKSEGSTQSVISTTEIAKTIFPIPSLNEQRAIINVLSSIDERIKASESQLAKTTAIKKALMQDLLTGKVRVNVNEKEKEPAVA